LLQGSRNIKAMWQQWVGPRSIWTGGNTSAASFTNLYTKRCVCVCVWFCLFCFICWDGITHLSPPNLWAPWMCFHFSYS
jgi:hypothetical protein